MRFAPFVQYEEGRHVGPQDGDQQFTGEGLLPEDGFSISRRD